MEALINWKKSLDGAANTECVKTKASIGVKVYAGEEGLSNTGAVLGGYE